MTNIKTDAAGSVNYPDKQIVTTPVNKPASDSSVINAYSPDSIINPKKAVISSNPFANPYEESLKKAREKSDAGAIFEIAKLQYEKNVIPGVKAADLFKEAYETALSEMDSDTLYAIGNFDALNNVLPEVSSEFIFKMADMTRRIY